jgi:chromosome partitioning protein
MVISIVNHKGGVGKTTSALNIGDGLNRLGYKVLLIDLDAQGNLTQGMGIADINNTIYTALRGITALIDVKVKDGLHIIPSNIDLSGAEAELYIEHNREYKLKELIAPIRAKYDYIIIDCPPSLGLLTINSLVASDKVLIPLQAQYLALQGLRELLKIVDKIRQRLNKRLKVMGIFITQFNKRKVLNRDVANYMREHFKELILDTMIRENIALAESPAHGLSIFDYEPTSNGAEDYINLCKEMLSNTDNNSNKSNSFIHNNRSNR